MTHLLGAMHVPIASAALSQNAVKQAHTHTHTKNILFKIKNSNKEIHGK